MDVITGIVGLLTSGAGGGILGGILGIAKQIQERKERTEQQRINTEILKLELEDAQKDRDHQLTLIEKNYSFEISKANNEKETELEVSYSEGLKKSITDEFNKLSTSTTVDNYRALIRPSLALWACFLFSTMLVWAFWNYATLIKPDQGLNILLDLFNTLNFTVVAIVTFYYYARKNSAPRV